ncbi:hypothetical protein HWV62_45280 [Athelia sp. TMB]|nr:hypothetical protein HWV62_45280 [Athelia sp. TMB]
MADNFLSIEVDDTSPTVAYTPFSDTFGEPDLSAGWNPYYSGSGYAALLGQLGEGSSSHRTSLDGASLTIQWAGTGIQLLGNVSQADFNLTLDGQPTTANSSSIEEGVLAQFHDLHDRNHTITLTVNLNLQSFNESFVAFDKALINSTQPANSTGVTIDNDSTTYSGHSSFTNFFTLLHYASELDDTVNHEVVVQNMENRTLAMSVGGINTTSLANNPSLLAASGSLSHSSVKSIHTAGTKAAIALSCLLFVLVLLGLGYFLGYHPRGKRRESQIHHTGQLEKEAEAGAAVLDISSARLGSAGTRFSFARLGIGRGSQSPSDLDIDMATELDSAGSVRHAVHKDPHSQWETYTISMPSMQYGPASPVSSRFPRHQSPIPSPPAVPANSHTRQDSGARLLDRGRSSGERDDDTDSSKHTDSGYHDAVEINLSPRTSEARSFNNPRPLVPYLTYEEPTPVEEHPREPRRSSRESSKFWRRSRSSHRSSVANEPMPPSKGPRRSMNGRHLSLVRFDPSASQPPSAIPRYSFLDFSSSSSSSNSSGTFFAPLGSEQQQQVSPTTPEPPSKRSRPLPNIATSVPLGILRSRPLQQETLHPPYSRSPPISPDYSSEPETETPSTPTPPDYDHSRSFNPIVPPPSRAPTFSLPLPPISTRPSGPTLLTASSTQRYHPEYRDIEESPTESFARSVSDINFRHISSSTASSRRTSAQGPYALEPPARMHKALIVQKVLGMQTPPTAQDEAEHPRASLSRLEPLRRMEDPEIRSQSPSTPFMQRVLRRAGGNERGSSQDFASPKSANSEASSPGIIRNLRRL